MALRGAALLDLSEGLRRLRKDDIMTLTRLLSLVNNALDGADLELP